MTVTSSRVLAGLSTLLLLPGLRAAADTPSADALPHITVSASAEATAPAARATFSIGIQTTGTTAAAAGAVGARLSNAVTAALRGAGLPPNDLKSTHLTINPQWVYDEHLHQQRRNGFQADTALIINTATLDKLGTWVDAALSAGATHVSDPAFAAADDGALRHLALSRALQNARGDAEVLAMASGGSLGTLLQIRQEQPAFSPMAFAVGGARRDAPPSPATNLTPDEIHATATVTGTWRYIPGPGAPSH